MARRATERGRMNHEHELTIQDHILDIEQTIEAKELTGPLYTKKIIDLQDMEFIQGGETRPERARRLLSVIVMRGPNSFPVFVDALRLMGYKELSEKLACACSSTEHITLNLRDGEEFGLLNNEISQLKLRVADVEVTRAKKTDLGELEKDVKGELAKVSATLQTIEDLSRVSRETTTTINTLRRQLDEKDKLLSDARKQIEKLQSKVSVLEEENAKFRRTLQKQQKEIQDLKQVQRKNVKKFQEIEDTQEKERKKNEADKKEMMACVNSLANQLSDLKVGNAQQMVNIRVNKKPIVSRNRFQKGN